jgi:hypothetical protein
MYDREMSNGFSTAGCGLLRFGFGVEDNGRCTEGGGTTGGGWLSNCVPFERFDLSIRIWIPLFATVSGGYPTHSTGKVTRHTHLSQRHVNEEPAN